MENDPRTPRSNTLAITFIWLAVFSGGFFFFGDALEAIKNPNRTVITHVNSNGEQEIVLERNRHGHYVANGLINGEDVRFILDTGATNVSIPEHIAKKLNLKKGTSFESITANGTVTSSATSLDSVSLGNLELRNVPASISRGMQFDEILLGMSFLKHLKITQQGKTLTLSIPEQKQ